MARGLPRRQSSQRNPQGHTAPGKGSLETLVRISRRSRMEAKRRYLKAFTERIASRDPDRQTAGPLKSRSASGCRLTRTNGVNLLLMTRFKALGTAETERMA